MQQIIHIANRLKTRIKKISVLPL